MITRPLAQSRADQRRFVDRTTETRAIVRAIAASQPVLVLGEPGSGRTSLLGHVAWLFARGDETLDSVIVSGEPARDPGQLLGVLVARLRRLAEPAGARGRWMQDLQALSRPDGPFGDLVEPAILMELIDLLDDQLDQLERPLCLMVDGIAPEVAHGLFGSLRNELWGLEGARWVVAGDIAAGPLYREPPADAFFAQTVELRPLSDRDAGKLLRAHLPELSDEEFEQAVAVAGGNPRRLLRAAAEIRAGIPPSEITTAARVRKADALAGPLARRLVQYLAAYGPSFASDERMLREIGASRQRASQLMHQLESAGLLHTLEQHEPGRRGRPVRRFALKDEH